MVNIFWIFLILRILYRALFSDVVKDERSDDETEVEEEKESSVSPEAKSGGNGQMEKPSLMLNGEEFSPVDAQAPATGMDIRGGEDVIKRKR
jgi:hypothetical protein